MELLDNSYVTQPLDTVKTRLVDKALDAIRGY